MLGRKGLAIALAMIVSFSLVGCGNKATAQSPFQKARGGSLVSGRLAEVAPPAAIQTLRKDLEVYQPQVKILSPRQDEILQDTKARVRLQVEDLPLFKNETFGLGPYLHFILDNQPYEAVYDVSQPIELSDLTPGSHTVRVFASRPWHESFKTEGAYAQVTFHVFAKTPDNNPGVDKPLLTYSRPKGSYGAEPILLDFYLTNAPLHLVAQADATDEIPDWKIRCTVNGESFVFDRWQPIYLKGFKPGKNWVQLELLDEKGEPIATPFNNTVRLIEYQPGGTDSLSQLTRGELAIEDVRGIVIPNYVKPEPQPEPQPETEVLPEPEVEPEPEVTPEPEVLEPEPEATPPAETSEAQPSVDQSEMAAPEPEPGEPAPEVEPEEELMTPATEDETAPAIAPTPEEVEPTPAPLPQESTPIEEPTADSIFPQDPTPEPITPPQEINTPLAPIPLSPRQPAPSRSNYPGLFTRFRDRAQELLQRSGDQAGQLSQQAQQWLENFRKDEAS
jgi:hypothetical protein